MTLPQALLEAIRGADPVAQRRAMAKAITLLESSRNDHRQTADDLLTQLIPHTGKALRLGLSGVPGVGKSTLIETLGMRLIERGHKVAVLAVDPSSSVSGGSILGDKTRMASLSVHENAFIRPSPSSGTLGGVAEKTRECMMVCEAAGYDVVIVETVGVGQSETAVAGMTDMFVLMQLPNAGDDLQAIKKGVMELADMILINKADMDAQAAERAQSFIQSAFQLLGHFHVASPDQWQAQVMTLSALNGTGVDTLWECVLSFQSSQLSSGHWQSRRQNQALQWLDERIQSGLKESFFQHEKVAASLSPMQQLVRSGQLAASTAARQLLALASQGKD